MLFNLVVGVTGMIVPWAKWFNEREHKGWRIAFFVSLAASAVAPIAHRALIYGAGNTFWFYSALSLRLYVEHFARVLTDSLERHLQVQPSPPSAPTSSVSRSTPTRFVILAAPSFFFL